MLTEIFRNHALVAGTQACDTFLDQYDKTSSGRSKAISCNILAYAAVETFNLGTSASSSGRGSLPEQAVSARFRKLEESLAEHLVSIQHAARELKSTQKTLQASYSLRHRLFAAWCITSLGIAMIQPRSSSYCMSTEELLQVRADTAVSEQRTPGLYALGSPSMKDPPGGTPCVDQVVFFNATELNNLPLDYRLCTPGVDNGERQTSPP